MSIALSKVALTPVTVLDPKRNTQRHTMRDGLRCSFNGVGIGFEERLFFLKFNVLCSELRMVHACHVR